jgi:hypothetical protein
MKRLGNSPEPRCAEYQRAEKRMESSEPKRMSKFEERILSSIDFDHAIKTHLENFLCLREKLGKLNAIIIEPSHCLPCYVIHS